MTDAQRMPEYYLAKAEEHPFVREALEGTATFRGRLDDLVGSLTDREGAPPRTETLTNDFKDYLTVLEDLSSAGLDVESLYYDGLCMSVYGFSKGVAGFFLGVGAIGAIGLIIPPLGVIEAVALAAGGGLGGLFTWLSQEERESRDRADEIFAPVYTAADAVDADIARCFPYGRPAQDFKPLSETEELAYRRMDAEGRQAVEADLRRRLAIGALDMGEVELGRYLKGLAGKPEDTKDPWWEDGPYRWG